jgi:hypothetical protein
MAAHYQEEHYFMKNYAVSAASVLALAMAVLVPSSALAYCNGAGSTCVQSNAYSKPYYNSQYVNPNAFAGQYGGYGYGGYAPYGGYGGFGGYYGQGYGYGYQQPLYFPVYNTTFPGYYGFGGYYGQNYGYSNYAYDYAYGYDYGYDYGGYDYAYDYWY